MILKVNVEFINKNSVTGYMFRKEIILLKAMSYCEAETNAANIIIEMFNPKNNEIFISNIAKVSADIIIPDNHPNTYSAKIINNKYKKPTTKTAILQAQSLNNAQQIIKDKTKPENKLYIEIKEIKKINVTIIAC